MPITNNSQEVPVNIVGSSTFGRYSTVSSARTYNMFITSSGDGQEEWLVNYAGYKNRVVLNDAGAVGRGLFHSVRGNFMLAVVGNQVYRINITVTSAVSVGSLSTSSGEVFIDENLNSQICIVDGTTAYIYNYDTGNFGAAVYAPNPDLRPNYVTYQNTYFIFGNGTTTSAGSNWYVYEYDGSVVSGLGIVLVQQRSLQTKPDFAVAALRMPGAGNNLLVLGSTVAEIWNNVGGLETYQRNTSVNIDYGCVSVATIAASDNFIAWLGINERSSPSIMMMQGGGANRISTDGIDFLLDDIERPDESTAIFYRQDGHLFYQLTFYNSADNITITYDVTAGKFYDLTDWNFNYHPARQVAYYDGQTYFVSLNNGTLYETGSDLISYQVNNDKNEEIPRMRICDTFRLPTPEKFIIDLFTFTIEEGTEPGLPSQGYVGSYIISEEGALLITEEGDFIVSEDFAIGNYSPRIDVRISKNGGYTWSNDVSYEMHNTAKYKNQPRFPKLGYANEITIQLRFWAFWRFVVKNGAIFIRS